MACCHPWGHGVGHDLANEKLYICIHIYIYAMLYHSAIKKNKTVSFVEIWIDLETVRRSEICRKRKPNIIE